MQFFKEQNEVVPALRKFTRVIKRDIIIGTERFVRPLQAVSDFLG
jgi:hypothetical protein